MILIEHLFREICVIHSSFLPPCCIWNAPLIRKYQVMQSKLLDHKCENVTLKTAKIILLDINGTCMIEISTIL